MNKKTFLSINFGCRVNSAEINQLSQTLINNGYVPTKTNPDIILINTCAITKKGEYESLSKIKQLKKLYPKAEIRVTGCANLSKIKNITQIGKTNINSTYTPQIKDKFSHTNRYLLKVQSGCTTNCTFCIVPSRRTKLEYLLISDAVKIVKEAVKNGYEEIIITGVNLAQYLPGLSDLVETLLKETKIKLISFGSVPLLCIDSKFISLITDYGLRITNNLHIPLQSGSDRILKLMHRPYDVKKIKEVFLALQHISELTFSTDIIVGFPTETEAEFKETYNLCQSIGFSHIHTFKYSPRPGTPARELFLKSAKISQDVLSIRSQMIRKLKESQNL